MKTRTRTFECIKTYKCGKIRKGQILTITGSFFTMNNRIISYIKNYRQFSYSFHYWKETTLHI